jgi:3-dehydroquinate synthase
LLDRAGLPLTHETLNPELLSNTLRSTVEHRDGRQRIPLLCGIGQVAFVDNLTAEELRDATVDLRAFTEVAGK